MKVVELYLGDSVEVKDELAVCIGYFDGLHLGHQKLIKSAVNYANQHNIKSGLMTFNPDPITIVRDEKQDKKHLYRMADRIEMGEQLGLDYWFILQFTKEMSQLSPSAFIEEILKPINVRFIACGADFRFAYKGAGNPAFLRDYANGFYDVEVLDLIEVDGVKVSSTRIIEELAKGNIELVTRLLGRPYHLKGPVIGGNRKGREIGFPTANIYVDDEYVLPKQGVYLGIAKVKDKYYPTMINVGHNLTFNTRIHLSIEGYIHDFDDTIYGELIEYHFIKYLRNELKFDTIEALVEQMQQDKLHMIAYFEGKDIMQMVSMI